MSCVCVCMCKHACLDQMSRAKQWKSTLRNVQTGPFNISQGLFCYIITTAIALAPFHTSVVYYVIFNKEIGEENGHDSKLDL